MHAQELCENTGGQQGDKSETPQSCCKVEKPKISLCRTLADYKHDIIDPLFPNLVGNFFLFNAAASLKTCKLYLIKYFILVPLRCEPFFF